MSEGPFDKYFPRRNPTKAEFEAARREGKRVVARDGGTTVVAYHWKGCVYLSQQLRIVDKEQP